MKDLRGIHYGKQVLNGGHIFHKCDLCIFQEKLLMSKNNLTVHSNTIEKL